MLHLHTELISTLVVFFEDQRWSYLSSHVTFYQFFVPIKLFLSHYGEEVLRAILMLSTNVKIRLPSEIVMAANQGWVSKEDKAYHPDLMCLSFIISIASFHVKWLQNPEHQPLDINEKNWLWAAWNTWPDWMENASCTLYFQDLT